MKVATLLALAVLAAYSATGNTTIWINAGSTSWMKASNWTNSVLPGATDDVQFGANPIGSTIVGIDMSSSSVNNGSHNEAVGAIEVTSARVDKLTVGDSSSTSGTLTFNGATVNGVANVVLENANSGGNDLVIRDNGGSTGLMPFALADTTENIVSLDSSGGITIGDTIVSSNGLTTPLTFAGSGSGIISITGTANTFSGNVKLTGTEVDFSGDGSLGNATNNITVNGGRFAVPINTSVTLSSGRTIFLGTNSAGAGAGTSLGVSGSSGVLTYNGALADLPGSIGTLVKQGSGTLSLGGTSTYSGDTSINYGVLKLTTGNNRLPVGTTIYLGQSASANLGTLDLNGNSQQIAGLDSTPGMNMTAAKNIITNSSASVSTLTLSGGGNYAYGDGTSNNSGIITGLINLVKTGCGIQILGDTNTCRGSTTISNGALIINGSLGTNACLVNSNAVLGGTGVIRSCVTINSGGSIAPGNCSGNIGTLTITNLLLQPGGTNVVKISNAAGTAGAGYDSVAVSGNIGVLATAGSPFTIRPVSLPPMNFNSASNYTWTIMNGKLTNFTSSAFLIDMNSFTNNLTGGKFSVTTNNTGLVLNFTSNHTPVANAATFCRARNTALKIRIANLMSNSSDPAGDPVGLVSVAGGLLTNNTVIATTTNGSSVCVVSNCNGTACIILTPTNNLNESLRYVVNDTSLPVLTATNLVTIIVTNSVGQTGGNLLSIGANSVTTTWAGVVGCNYAVQRSTNMVDWVDIWPTNNVPGVFSFTDTFQDLGGTPPARAYYRLRQN
jgi:autotransporter-associated beta strand protein